MSGRLFILLAALLFARASQAASACTNPGKDGPATGLSGIVNTYYPGTGSASAGSSSVTVGAIDTSMGGASTPIGPGDLALVIQMQDADIDTSNDATYGGGGASGSGQIALNGAGAYEYATVSASYVSGSSTITFSSPLVNSYRTAAATSGAGQRTFQVVRVPQLSTATLSGTVTGAGWNGATGGIVAIDVAGNLSWNSGAIDVTGLGFRGGGALWMTGKGTGQSAFAATDYVTNLTGNLPSLSPNPSTTPGPFAGSNGPKGEGIAGTPRYLFLPAAAGPVTIGAGSIFDTGVEGYPGGSLARGAPGNAGGGGTDGDPNTATAGGNDQNTGGGGGGGYATGGTGGYGWTPGTPPGSPTGGMGGQGVPMSAGRMTLGGGGGAATTNNATGTPGYGIASSGAPGGGIVLLRAKTITGSGTVRARGANGNQSLCNDASGGGGGGGAVLVYASGNNGSVGTLNLNVSGGGGGSNTGNGTGNNSGVCGSYSGQPHGPGGGGGGGFVALSSISSATINVAGGANGTTSPSPTSTSEYGSTSSPGGYQITAVSSTDLPGSGPSSLCYPLLTVTKSAARATTVQGGTASYVITVANAAGHGTATSAILSDTLVSGLNIATTDSVTLSGGATRTGVSNPAAGATSASWGAFTIPAGGAVSVSFTANVPAATPLGTIQNSATVAYDDPTRSSGGQTVTPGGGYSTGDTVLGTNYASSSSTADDVTVYAPVTIIEGFGPISVTPGGSTTLSITVTNPNALALTAASLADALPAGLSMTGGALTVTGTGCSGFVPATLTAGATSLALSTGTVPASGACTLSFSVTASSAQSYTNTLSAISFNDAQGVYNTAAASATLLTRPSIVDAFTPSGIAAGGTSTLSFTIANPNAAQSLSGLAFTDAFPSGLVAVGGSVSASGTGCTGFLPASLAANATSFALTAGTVPAGGSCTLSFAVTSATQGGYSNVTSGVSANETVLAGNASNTATLAVGTIGAAKTFAPATIQSGGTSTVTVTLSNPTSVAQTAGQFTDTLSGMSVSGAQSVGGTCTGTTPSSLTNGATSLAFTGIAIPASSSCTVSFVVASSTPGVQTNTTSGVRTALLPLGPASNSAQLTVTGAPTIANSFSPSTLETNGASTLTFTLTSNDVIPLTGAAFSDVLPSGLFVAGSGTVTAGGTCAGASANSFTAGASGATLSLSGLTIPAGAGGCTVTVPISSTAVSVAAGYADNASGVSSNEAATSAAAAVTHLIVVAPATIAKSFATSPIAQGGTSVVTFTLASTSNIALTSATFSDTLVNMQVASTANAAGTCTGASSNSFTAGQTGNLTFSGLTIPAAGSCTVTLTLTSSTAGANSNTASGVSSAQTPVAGAVSNTAVLAVDSPPTMSLGFNPGTILTGAKTTLTITLTNSNAVALTGTAFSTSLVGMQVTANAAGSCAGSGGNHFNVGDTSLSFSAITIPANGSCTVTIPITSNSVSPADGWPVQFTGATTTQTPTVGPVPAPVDLTVLNYPAIAEAFTPNAIAVGGTSTLVFTLTNPDATELTGVNFTDTLPGNLTTIAGSQSYIGSGRGTCTGAIPSAGSGSGTALSFAGILLQPNASCTIMVDVTSSTANSYTTTATGLIANETGTKAGTAPAAAVIDVGGIAIQKSFVPGSIGVGDTSVLTFVLNSAESTSSANVNFIDTFPNGLTVASPLTTGTSCGGSFLDDKNHTLIVGSTGITFSGATIAAGGSCTVTVNVTASAAGSLANTTQQVKIGGAGAGPNSNTATLTVVKKATITESISPASLDTWKTAVVTFTLNNPNTAGLTSCTITDALGGLQIASPASIGGTCAGTVNNPTLAAGATALNLSIPSLDIGTCTITVPVTSGTAGTDSNASSGVLCKEYGSAGAAPASSSVTFAKLPLSVMKNANVTTATPGSAITYTISFTNPNAQQSLQNIVVTDTTPQFTLYSSAACATLPRSLNTCTVSAPAPGAQGAIIWTFGGTLDPGQTGTVTLTVTVQ